MTHKRMKPEARKEEILAAALALCTMGAHYTKITRDAIAAKAGVSPTAVQYHFKTMAQLKKQLIRAAVKTECLPVIMQGYVARDAFVLRASPELLQRAVDSVAL